MSEDGRHRENGSNKTIGAFTEEVKTRTGELKGKCVVGLLEILRLHFTV